MNDNVIWDAIKIRRENKPKPERVTEGELVGLLLSARLNAEANPRNKQWRDLVAALEELKERRWEESSRG